MGVFFIFLSYLWSNLWWFLTSGPLVVEPMLDYLIEGYEDWASRFISRQKRRQIAYGLSLLGIVFASFLAFKDVYLELQTVRQALTDAQQTLTARGLEELVKEIRRVQTTNVQLETELRAAQHELLVLQDSLKARRLSPEERKKFTDVLASYNGQQFGIIDVRAFPSCHECMIYVYDIASAINSIPSWTARAGGNYHIKVDFSGIGIGINNPTSLPPIAHVLTDALKAARLPFTIESLDFLRSDDCMLVVGNKP
jgi:hypothetical protein